MLPIFWHDLGQTADTRCMRIQHALVGLMLCACSGTPTGADGGSADASADVGAEASVDAGTSLLDTCSATVGATVPAFYKTYFRCTDLSVNGSNLVISTKGQPPYKTYYYGPASTNYASFDTSRGNQYSPNPNTIKVQSVTFNVPLTPTAKSNLTITSGLIDGVVGTSSQEYKMGSAGVAINSVIMFNPLAAPGDDIENEKYTFDDYNGHPEMTGNYHYHTTTKGPLQVLSKLGFTTATEPGTATIELYGMMCDGTLVMGCTELSGATPILTGFDAQNGHAHDIIDNNNQTLLTNRYHVHLCPTKWTSNPRKFTPEIQYYTTCN